MFAGHLKNLNGFQTAFSQPTSLYCSRIQAVYLQHPSFAGLRVEISAVYIGTVVFFTPTSTSISADKFNIGFAVAVRTVNTVDINSVLEPLNTDLASNGNRFR